MRSTVWGLESSKCRWLPPCQPSLERALSSQACICRTVRGRFRSQQHTRDETSEEASEEARSTSNRVCVCLEREMGANAFNSHDYVILFTLKLDKLPTTGHNEDRGQSRFPTSTMTMAAGLYHPCTSVPPEARLECSSLRSRLRRGCRELSRAA